MVEDQGLYTLLVLESAIVDAGSYECVAINQAGEGRCQAQLTMTGASKQAAASSSAATEEGSAVAPAIIEKMQAHIVNEGQPVTFKCLIKAQPGMQRDKKVFFC